MNATISKHSSKYLHWLYDHFLHIHWELNPEVKLLVTQSLVKFFVDMMDDVREQPYQRLFLELSSSLLVKAPLEISEALLSDDKMKVLFKDYLQRMVTISEELQVPSQKWHQWIFECISLGEGTRVEKNFLGRSLSLQWNEPSPFLSNLRVEFVSEDNKQQSYPRIEPFIKLHHPTREIRKQYLDRLLPFLHISPTKADDLRSRLVAQAGWESVPIEIEAETNTSWKYFFGRLTHFVQAGIPLDVNLLFPNDPAMFRRHFPLSPTAIENPSTFCTEWFTLFQRRSEVDGFEIALSDLLAFPFGGNLSSSEIIRRFIDSGEFSDSEAVEKVSELADRTTNPVALQNCLDILLTLQEGATTPIDDIHVIIQKLLDPESITDPVALVPLFEFCIIALRFAWSQMQTHEPFQKCSVREWIVWAYAYARALIEVLDHLRKDQNILFDYATFSRWLAEKIEPPWRRDIFAKSFNEQLEISHPMKVSRFRTIVSGTLGILLKHESKLRWSNVELLGKAVSITQLAIQGAMSGAEEIFKPFDSTRNFFNVSFDQNVFLSLKEIFQLLEEGSLESLEESEHRLIQYVREFDPHTALTTTLRRIVDQRVWELNDLVLIYIVLSEPLDRSLIEILRQAIMHLDFSRWLEEKDFTLACLTLAQCANASNDIEVQNRIMEKLTDAWVRLARQMAQYNAILSATIIVIANSIEEDKATEFYKWWREAIERMQGQIPEEIYEIAVSLAWRLPITQRQGLWDIKSRLAVLM